MKLTTLQTLAGAMALLLAPICEANASHQRLHQLHAKKHAHGHAHKHIRDPRESPHVEERQVTCSFPSDSNLVAVTPDSDNAGWAMSPDQKCTAGKYCPYACKPGMVMAQWKPGSTYTYPASMDGGLLCGNDGQAVKPFEDKPYCVPGVGNVKVVNNVGKQQAWCQTVLPGSESMLIPTIVESEATLAVPGTNYWCSTAAHYYINAPDTGVDACIWGTSSQPIGNWAPYVAGANQDHTGNTFVKLAYNPIFTAETLLNKKKPSFGVEIKCSGGDCVGLPCKIDPRKGLNVVESILSAVGVGGADFCVVTVPQGATAEFHVFSTDGSDSDGDNKFNALEVSSKSSAPPKPSTTSTTSTTSTSTTSSTTSTTSTSSTTSTTSTTSSSTSTTPSSTTVATPTSSQKHHPTPALLPGGVFQENSTSTDDSAPDAGLSSSSGGSSTSSGPTTKTSDKDGAAGRQQGNAPLAGLVVAFIALAYFF